MKTLLQLIILINIIVPASILSQSKFEINSIGIDNQYYFHNLHNMKINSFESRDKMIILKNENINNQSTFLENKSIITNGFDLLFEIKRRNKVKSSKLFQSFSIGLGYRSIIKNAIQFFEERPNGGFNPDKIWASILLGNSKTATKTTSYEIQSKNFSIQCQEMVWLLNGKLFNFGAGLKADIGFEFNSKMIQKNYLGGSTSSIWGKNSYSNLVSTKDHYSKNRTFFIGSIPIRLSMRLSTNKEKLRNKIKLVTSILLGIQKSLFLDENNSSFSSIGFGMRYEL